MKGKTFFAVTLSIASVISSVALSGCSGWDKAKATLDAPIVTRIGSLLKWDAVEGANKYLVSYGDSSAETTETVCHIDNIETGGTFTVKAVKADGKGKIKEFSEPVTIDISGISVGSQKYAEYAIADGDVTVPSYVEKAVISGDSTGVYDFGITIEARTLPLILELYDVNCNYIKYDGDLTRADECVVIRSLGKEGSMFCATAGTNGGNGGDGDGLAGSGGTGGKGTDGGNGGVFGYVVFEGKKPISFNGGAGGNGGNGGKPSPMNSKGGDGGAGGNGGIGLSVTQTYVMPGVELTYAGGAGGNGGSGGEGRFLLWEDSGKAGSRGNVGLDLVGTRTDVTHAAALSGAVKSPETEEDADIFGTYYVTMMIKDNEIVKVGDVKDDGTKFEKTDVILELASDGTCKFLIKGADGKDGVWERGDGFIMISLDNQYMKATFDKGVMTLENSDDVKMLMSRS